LLTEPPAPARLKLEARVTLGRELREQARKVVNPEMLEQLERGIQAWRDYNKGLLRRLFTTDELESEYTLRTYSPVLFLDGRPTPWNKKLLDEIKDLEEQIGGLESIIGRLELFHIVGGAEPRVMAAQDPLAVVTDRSKVFIVHGRDNDAKQTVARFVERLGLEPVILHEQPSLGKTIIEKLEHYADVGFAVVLLTPDDEGRLSGSSEAVKPRARQNVLLELGLFVGRLGRRNVCAICKPPVDIPSDWDGVVWVAMDEHDGWKVTLARELKAAGFTIDASALL
jgi:hypothetical protein